MLSRGNKLQSCLCGRTLVLTLELVLYLMHELLPWSDESCLNANFIFFHSHLHDAQGICQLLAFKVSFVPIC